MERFKAGIAGYKTGPVDEQSYRQWLVGELKEMVKEKVKLCLLPGPVGLVWGEGKIFKGLEEETLESFYHYHGELARSYSIFLVPGYLPVMDNGQLFMEAVLFNDRGEVVGKQRQTNIIWEEGFTPASTLEVFSTSLGKMGLVIGSDLFFPEVSRILALQGADIILAPACYHCRTDDIISLAGTWKEAQQNQFFALEAPYRGEFASLSFAGLNGIYAPCEATEDRSGIIEQGTQRITGEVDYQKLQEARQNFPVLKQLNTRFCKRFMAGEGSWI